MGDDDDADNAATAGAGQDGLSQGWQLSLRCRQAGARFTLRTIVQAAHSTQHTALCTLRRTTHRPELRHTNGGTAQTEQRRARLELAGWLLAGWRAGGRGGRSAAQCRAA